MLNILQRIVREVSAATDLEEAASIIVRQVKEATAVDACAVYSVDTQDGACLLMATEGPESTTLDRARIGPTERLIGLVVERQEPLNVEDASRHPTYEATRGMGEEPYRAFLGVPIIQRRKVMGVLVVRRKEASTFDENTVAFVLTVAAQLSGAITDAITDGSINRLLGGQEASSLQGIPGTPGIGIGTITAVFSPTSLESMPDRDVEDMVGEERAFRAAVAKVQEEFRSLGARFAAVLPSEERALFDAYVMLSGSDSIVNDTVHRIRAGNWAPGALRDTVSEHARVFDEMADPYLRARANDIRDIGAHILSRLQSEVTEPIEYSEHCVLVGDQVTVAQLADVPVERLVGVVCTQGSGVSHTAILARALGIPAVMGIGLRHLSTRRLNGRDIIVDGYQGRIYIHPSDSVRGEYQRLARQEREIATELEKLRDVPALTLDGVRISLYANSGLLSDVPSAMACGAEGIGLYRTEFGFMVRSGFPGEDEQYRTYRKALLLFAPKPVTMRTLDIGGDKSLPYFKVAEENPALGWRGIRVTLDHPEIFITQLRAMLRANAGLNNLLLLLPMVVNPSEVDEALTLLDRAHRELSEAGQASARPRVGMMVETPAAACQISALAKRVDFLSIGTNDLTQHLLVVDRNNPRVTGLYESLHPAVIRVVNDVIEEAHRWGKPVSVCGEMAGDPSAAVLLLGMGVNILSVAAADLPRIKRVMRSVSQREARELLLEVLGMEDVEMIRNRLTGVLKAAGLEALTGLREPRA